MSDTLKIALAQINPHVGQVVHNLDRIRRAGVQRVAFTVDSKPAK